MMVPKALAEGKGETARPLHYAFSTFRHLKRFGLKAGKKLPSSLSEYAEKKISIHRSCGWVVVGMDRDSWNFIGGSGTPSGSFHVCYLRGP